ncbi:MAG: thioredoxin family protein [Eubacteriales bacterium]|nr:thioredoxin family protein [Eubacteriales bacterium]
MEIKVIGAGCRECDKLYEDVCTVCNRLGISAEIEKVEDLVEIVRLGVMSAPSLMVNGKLVVSGHVPNIKKLTGILETEAGAIQK